MMLGFDVLIACSFIPAAVAAGGDATIRSDWVPPTAARGYRAFRALLGGRRQPPRKTLSPGEGSGGHTRSVRRDGLRTVAGMVLSLVRTSGGSRFNPLKTGAVGQSSMVSSANHQNSYMKSEVRGFLRNPEVASRGLRTKCLA